MKEAADRGGLANPKDHSFDPPTRYSLNGQDYGMLRTYRLERSAGLKLAGPLPPARSRSARPRR
jgi:hypothetical protein